MKTVAVIFGGQSTEHDVSVVTAILSIIKPLRALGGYDIEPVYITKDGQWFWDKKLADIELFRTGQIAEFIRSAAPTQLLFDKGLTLVKSSKFAGRKAYKTVDVVFPATHGTYGEDGSLMGLLRMANVPFVGCDMDASVLAMDKVLAKLIAEAHHIPTPRMKFFSRSDYATSGSSIIADIEKSLAYPLFVKPSHLGSSIGISRATTTAELRNAVEVALHYDTKVLVEEEVPNLVEVTLPVMGNPGDTLRPALLERPLTKADDFFDFDTKYMNGGKGGKKGGGKSGAQGYSQLPAELPKPLYDKAEALGLDVYRALGCQGIARVDMLIDEKQSKVYFNEVNPLPGSLYSHNWRAAGVSNVQLVENLIHLAEVAFKERTASTTSFSTNYLKQF